MSKWLLRLVLVVAFMCLSVVSVAASGEQTWQGIAQSGTSSFYGHCMGYSGSGGVYLYGLVTANSSTVSDNRQAFGGQYDVKQWQSNPQGFFPGTVLRVYCQVEDASYNILASGFDVYTVPP
jgi:hypothetical protein